MSGEMTRHRRLLERYAALEPQSRTYPEVSVLDDRFGEQQFRHHVGRSNAALIPKPIAIYLNFPEVLRNKEHYTEQLLRELELIAPCFDRDRDVVRLQWCGAADRLNPELLSRVLESINRQFHVADTAVHGYRVDMDAADVDAGRIAATRADRTRGTDVQITFGLAPQSRDSLKATIQAVTRARPDGIDLVDGVLTLPRKPSMPLLDATTRLSMLEHAVDLLLDAGYTHTCKGRFDLAGPGGQEIDCDRIGLGPGSISQLGDCVCENYSAIPRWQSAIDTRHWPVARGKSLTAEERRHAARSRCLLGTSDAIKYTVEQNLDMSVKGLDELRQLENMGLIRTKDHRIASTSRGRYLWRILARCLDPEWTLDGPATPQAGRYAEECRRGETAQ